MSLTPSEQAYLHKQRRRDQYQLKLQDPRWIATRNRIIKRDDGVCQICFQPEWEVEVHHLAYRGENPWDVPDIFLQTRCRRCHASAHGKTGRRRRKQRCSQATLYADDPYYRSTCQDEIWYNWDNPPLRFEDDLGQMPSGVKKSFEEVYASGLWRSLKLVQCEVLKAQVIVGPQGERALLGHSGLDYNCYWLYSIPTSNRTDPLQRKHTADKFENDLNQRLHYHCEYPIDIFHLTY